MIIAPQRITRTRSPEIKIEKFGGVDYSTTSTLIESYRASDMENMMLDTKGMLQQIPGYRKAITGTVSAGTTPVRLLSYDRIADKYIKVHGGKIYTFTPGGAEAELYTPVTDAKMKDFVMEGYRYFYNGTDFLRWAGTGSVATVEASAFIPTTIIARLPAGGGTTLEAVNLIQPGRINSFIGDGTTMAYQLDSIDLDATLVTATVGGVAKTETTDFTVNRTTGIVTFTAAPADGSGVDNVVITFYKTVTGYANRIKNCTTHEMFGIGNNQRIFMTGNTNYRNTDWYCAMLDPTYWPDTNYTKVGSGQVAIKGYALQLGVMHILKEDSQTETSMWTRSTSVATDGTLYFPIKPNNTSVGCLATNSIMVIDDVPVTLTGNGVYQIVATNIIDERGLKKVSENIDPVLLKEENLDKAESFNHEGRYGIAVNGNVYIIDYNNGGECYIWKGIPASCFMEREKTLYFGDSASGNVYAMNKLGETDNTNLFDDKPIESFWYSKMFSMERANYYKMIDSLAVTLIPLSARSGLSIYYRTNKKSEKLVKEIVLTRFDINNIDLNDFSLLVSDLPQTINREVNISDFIYFQIIIKNAIPGKGLAVSNITIPYSFAGQL